MKGAVPVESVVVAFAHGIWFLPALEAAGQLSLAPAGRCTLRELGWSAFAVFVVTSPWHPLLLGLDLWVPWMILPLVAAPGAWALVRWAWSARALGQLRTARASSHLGVPVEFGDVPVPLTWGVAPRIVLPLEARSWPREQIDAVLAHEHAHVVRRDYVRRGLAHVVGVVLGAHPLFAWSLRRHALDVEKAADALAVVNHDRSNYARALLELGTRRAAPRAALSSGSHLVARIEALVGPPPRRRPELALALVLVVTTVGLAAPTVAPEPPPAPSPPHCAP